MKKKLLWLAVIMLWVVMITGFSLTTAAAEGKVVLVVRTGPEADGLRVTAKEYTKKTGVNVEIVEIGRAGYLTAVMTQLVAGTSDYDVVWFLSTSIAGMAEAGVLEPIDDYINNPKLTDPAEFDSKDLLATYGYKGKTYGLPQTISTNYLYYRSDLIPNPPQTWDEYFEVAKKFTKSINPSSPTTYGTVIDCLPGEELPKCFYSLLWTCKGDIIDDDGNVVINSPAAIGAADWYVKFVNAGGGLCEMQTADCQRGGGSQGAECSGGYC